jgi:hypothetical protein
MPRSIEIASPAVQAPTAQDQENAEIDRDRVACGASSYSARPRKCGERSRLGRLQCRLLSTCSDPFF